jgi:hypothetical protein
VSASDVTGEAAAVDRPTTRRRRHATNAESVSVADLLARTTPAEMASVSAIKARAAAEASARAAEEALIRTGVPLMQFPVDAEPAASTDEPPTSNRLARTIMAATAAMLVCGVVTAIAVLTGERPHRLSPSVPTVGPAEITGPTVLRPDLLSDQLEAGLLVVGHRPATGDPAGTRSSDDPQATSGTVTLPEPSSEPTDAAAPTERVRRFIEDFYDKADREPAAAFELLAPQMQGEGRATFVEAWGEEITHVELQDLVVGAGGVARAVVVVAWKDATVLRTEQLLLVAEEPEPRIVRAQLLSAHRG